MGIWHESSCNGCAECVGCGRKSANYTIYYCDECCTSNGDLYYVDNQIMCEDCLLESLEAKELYEGDTDVCMRCSTPNTDPNLYDILYNVDGEWLCKSCALERFTKVDKEV